MSVSLTLFPLMFISNPALLGFADRHFYSDWWNSCDWLEFSREWNIPVHHFFRRHVYSASRSMLSRPFATVLTFVISALAHELVMGCITKKLRGYGFFMMMMQIPIVALQKSRFIRGRTLLNVSALSLNSTVRELMRCLECAFLVFDDIWTINGKFLAISDYTSVANGNRCVHFMSSFEAHCIYSTYIDFLLQSK
jgi:hypothetical protein